jgi:peroxiredoxin Q/BCP
MSAHQISMSTLNTGDMAPAFSGVDQDGLPVDLKDHLGGKVLLYFYPKDDTPGCTTEACNLRDAHEDLLKAGYSVIGVSPDTVAKHKKFATKYGLPFRLLADTDRSVANAYGVWGRKKFMGREYEGILRTTFLIDEKGYIERVIADVRTKDHAAQVLGDQVTIAPPLTH